MYLGPFNIPAATANATLVATLGEGVGTVAYSITGLTASAATLTLEASDDNQVTWYPVRFMGTSVVRGATTVTTDGIYSVSGAGHSHLRWRVTTTGTGTIVAGYNVSTATRGVNMEGAGVDPGNPLFVTLSASAFATGASCYSKMATADTNAAVIKASKGRVLGYQFFNNTAAAKYVKLYNKATAPTVGTDVPVRRIVIPANGVAAFTLPAGIDTFPLGIAIAVTGGLTLPSGQDLYVRAQTVGMYGPSPWSPDVQIKT